MIARSITEAAAELYTAAIDKQYNILTWGTGGRALTLSGHLTGEVIIMTTYEKLQILLGVAMLIVAILNMKNKK